MDDLKEHDRGRPLSGAAALAAYIFGDERRRGAVYQLPRDEFGLIILGGEITGFTGWIDAALAARARAGGKRPRRRRAAGGPQALIGASLSGRQVEEPA